MGFNPFRRWTTESGAGKADRDSRIGAPEARVYYPKPNAELDARWTALRNPGLARNGPSPEAQALLDQLPAGLLEQTARDYPHLIEKFAANWSSPTAMRKVFEELTFETRVARQGFPLAILNELTELRERYENAQPR
ncbi:MAG: hypothetical protein WCN85_16680 [Burkholderiales bacterium]